MSAAHRNIRGMSSNLIRAAALVVGMTVAMGLVGTMAWAAEDLNQSVNACSDTQILPQANQANQAVLASTALVSQAQELRSVDRIEADGIEADRIDRADEHTGSEMQNPAGRSDNDPQDGDELLDGRAALQDNETADTLKRQQMKTHEAASQRSLTSSESGMRINRAADDVDCDNIEEPAIECPDTAGGDGAKLINKADALLAEAQLAQAQQAEMKAAESENAGLRHRELSPAKVAHLSDTAVSNSKKQEENPNAAELESDAELLAHAKLSSENHAAALELDTGQASAVRDSSAMQLSRGQRLAAPASRCDQTLPAQPSDEIFVAAPAPVVVAPAPATEDPESATENATALPEPIASAEDDAEVLPEPIASLEDDADVPAQRVSGPAIAQPADKAADAEVLAAGADQQETANGSEDHVANVLADTGVSTKQLLMLASALLAIGIALVAGVGRNRESAQPSRN